MFEEEIWNSEYKRVSLCVFLTVVNSVQSNGTQLTVITPLKHINLDISENLVLLW